MITDQMSHFNILTCQMSHRITMYVAQSDTLESVPCLSQMTLQIIIVFSKI